jgi:hypothetical protein
MRTQVTGRDVAHGILAARALTYGIKLRANFMWCVKILLPKSPSSRPGEAGSTFSRGYQRWRSSQEKNVCLLSPTSSCGAASFAFLACSSQAVAARKQEKWRAGGSQPSRILFSRCIKEKTDWSWAETKLPNECLEAEANLFTKM